VCRFAAYVGPPRPLSALLYDPPRSLEVQAYDPREMLSAHVNVDGTGVAWWPADDADGRPLRYVTTTTPWADPNLPALAPRLTGRVQVAAVRAATPGIPFGPGNVAPFVHEGVAFAHNGWLGGYRKGVGRTLLSRLPDDLHGAVDAVSDSVTLFATYLGHLRGDAVGDLAAAARATVAEVREVVAAAGEAATLNLLVSDGTTVVAVRASHDHATNSLYTLRDGGAWPGAAVVASEPLDADPAWAPVPEDALVTMSPDRIDTEQLDL
jgi:glutamine amidotransferase